MQDLYVKNEFCFVVEIYNSSCMIIIQVLIDAIMRHSLLTDRTGNSHAFLHAFILDSISIR